MVVPTNTTTSTTTTGTSNDIDCESSGLSRLSHLHLPSPSSTFPLSESGEPVTYIDGLEYYPNFFSEKEQEELLQLIDSQPWQSGIIARRQQFYGEIYYHTSFQSSKLQPTQTKTTTTTTTACTKHNHNNGDNNDTNDGDYYDTYSGSSPRDTILQPIQHPAVATTTTTTTTTTIPPPQGISLRDSGMQYWLERTRPFFPKDSSLPTQVLVNEYRNNLGIASHFEDFDAFGDTIVTISLINPIYMTLKRPTERTNACDTYHDIVKILLEPGSILVMKRDARYQYRHGIGKSKWVHVVTTTTRKTTGNGGNGNDDYIEEKDNVDTVGSSSYSIQRNDSYRRLSLTIRHLLHTRRQVSTERDEQDTIKDPNKY
ncbi:2OG-Fe(II) oxygenase superfamily-domain containing protein [Nitzschia inconspicua]|uniref:2OG-Fe(II) oxygenase superfamily-domain containing protein n=1 Tax=Nitzschia inconspicua TaxID=303405 RepID=A0A9K3KV33_9STRA|nr:2OG-Fe(II) oxygenase superfamily-domain containing protein [Nitzschia inconspicua]